MGLRLRRAPALTDEQGVARNNLWWATDVDSDEPPSRYHTLEDLNQMTVPNDAAIMYANEYFCLKQSSGWLDDDLGDEWDNALIDPSPSRPTLTSLASILTSTSILMHTSRMTSMSM